MSLLGNVKGWWAQRQGSKGAGLAGPDYVGSATQFSSPPRRGTVELLRAVRTMPWLRAVVMRIAWDVAAVPWVVLRPPEGASRASRGTLVKSLSRMPAHVRDIAVRSAREQGDLVEVFDHPLLDLLEKGSALIDGRAVRQVGQAYMDVKGESFTGLTRGPEGIPESMWPIPPHWVQDVPGLHRPDFKLNVRGKTFSLARDSVIWMRDVDLENPYGRGAGVGEALSDELDTDEYTAAWMRAYYYNGATPPAVVSFPGADEAVVRAAEARWNDGHRGPSRAHRIHFTNAEAKVTRFDDGVNMGGAISAREFLRNTFVQVYGVPPEKVGINESSNRATSVEAERLYSKSVLVSRLEAWRVALQLQLAIYYGDVLVDYVSPVPEDREFALEVMRAAPSHFRRSEWRTLAGIGLKSTKADDVYVMPLTSYERPAPVGGEPEDEDPEEPPADEPVTPPQDEPAQPAPEPGNDLALSDAIARAAAPETKAEEDPLFVREVLGSLHAEPLTSRLNEPWRKRMRARIAKLGRDLGVEVDMELINPLVDDHMAAFLGDRIRGMVQGTTRDLLRSQMIEGFRAGESAKDLAKRVRAVFADADARRSILIARTETLRSSNAATWEAHKLSGVVAWREWVATMDDRTRDAHAALDGQIVGLEEPFVVPSGEYAGARAFFPGDFDDAALSCNERCTTVRSERGPEEPRPEGEAMAAWVEKRQAAWKDFDASTTAWEKQAIPLVRAGFREQRRDVLKALDEALS